MSRFFRLAIVALIAMTSLLSMQVAAQTAMTSGVAYFTDTSGAAVTSGSFVITDSEGTIVRQGEIGGRGSNLFLGDSFVIGETYTITAVSNGYKGATQTLVAGTPRVEFNVVFEPLEEVKKTITIGVSKTGPSGWFLAEAPEGSTWTLTNVSSGRVYSGTFSGAVPQTITLPSAVGSGTYLVEIDAGPTFLPYEETVMIRGNSTALYFEIVPNTSVVDL